MTSRPDQPCPGCGRTVPRSDRYPVYLCRECVGRAVDAAGRAVSLWNESLSGGFLATYADGSPAPEVTRDRIVYVDGVRCHADEAHLGGIVVIPAPPDAPPALAKGDSQP